MKKKIEFTCDNPDLTQEEAIAISHALAEIVNRTFANQELLNSGSNWNSPELNFRKPFSLRGQGWSR